MNWYELIWFDIDISNMSTFQDSRASAWTGIPSFTGYEVLEGLEPFYQLPFLHFEACVMLPDSNSKTETERNPRGYEWFFSFISLSYAIQISIFDDFWSWKRGKMGKNIFWHMIGGSWMPIWREKLWKAVIPPNERGFSVTARST